MVAPENKRDPHELSRAKNTTLPIHWRTTFKKVGDKWREVAIQCDGSGNFPKKVYRDDSHIVGLCQGDCGFGFRFSENSWKKE